LGNVLSRTAQLPQKPENLMDLKKKLLIEEHQGFDWIPFSNLRPVLFLFFFLLGKISVTHNLVCKISASVSCLTGSVYKVHEPSICCFSLTSAVGHCAHLQEELIKSILYLTSLLTYSLCPITKIF